MSFTKHKINIGISVFVSYKNKLNEMEYLNQIIYQIRDAKKYIASELIAINILKNIEILAAIHKSENKFGLHKSENKFELHKSENEFGLLKSEKMLHICCMARSLRSLRQVATLRHGHMARRSASLRSCI